MKLVAVRIRNFKLLRSIDIRFGTDKGKTLTVIRAENGSGKTSFLQALRWALYGKDVLDDPLVRLSPADWPDKSPCAVSVEVDFIHTTASSVGGVTMIAETSYTLKRQVEERPAGDVPNRSQDRVALYEKTPAGSEPISAAEARLAQMLPKEMVDIFFTDGDAAMTFISPQLSNNAKRDKVKDAIRSLLGLDLLERVAKRIATAQSSVNRRISRATSSDKLSAVSDEIVEITEKRDQLTNSVNTLNSQIEDIERKLTHVSRELTRVLEAGSYEHLAHQRENYRTQNEDALKEDEQLKRRHQALFNKESLNWALAGPSLLKGYRVLQRLHERGVIPSAAVPVLEERLDIEKCICGAVLSPGSSARARVEAIIYEHRENDDQINYLSSLYYHARAEVEKWQDRQTAQWIGDRDDIQRQRVAVKTRIEHANLELKSVKAKIDNIDSEEIEAKRAYEKTLTSARLAKNSERDRAEIFLKEAIARLKELTREQRQLSRADQRLAALNAEKTALDDLERVVDGTLKEMNNTYLTAVSDRMNELFLTMIGADPEQNAIFQSTEISDKYSIVVRTADNRTLNPDYEVNGAAQRALTFAFIWALTEISRVVAPRVIDTPLGMMSGNVKRRVLEIVSRAAGQDVDRQVVLFLTQSEIAHTEDILDKRSCVTVTLTKTDDYPADLVNDPKATQSEVRLCGCNHRQYCNQCQRPNYHDFQLLYRTD